MLANLTGFANNAIAGMGSIICIMDKWISIHSTDAIAKHYLVLREFPLPKLALLIGLALTVGTTAGATATISLVQVGGTYDGVKANPGDTLVLSIQYTVGDGRVTLIDPGIVWGAEVASFDGGTETSFAAWNDGAVAMYPIATGDIALLSPNLANGWEKGTTIGGGASEPCVFGACTSLGTASFTLSGLGGVIDFAPYGIPGGTVIGYASGPCYSIPEDPDCWNEIPFTVIPEPTTASLLGLALLTLTLATRHRNR